MIKWGGFVLRCLTVLWPLFVGILKDFNETKKS